jgi:hypothetical protein
MPRILVLDIETQRAIVETFNLWPKYISIDNVITDARILCFAAKWHDEDKVLFKAAWEDDDQDGYRAMLNYAWGLMDEADFIVTWNGDKFDVQWFEGEFARLGMGRPSPYKSLDLIKTAKRKFGKSLLSLKLDWSSRQWLGDQKTSHEGIDLWHEIRYGNKRQQREAQRIMREYNEHDVELTGELLDSYLPWLGINMAVVDGVGFGCTTCGSTNLQRRGTRPSGSFLYQQYCCNDCGSWSRAPKNVGSTALRPVG